MKTYAEYLNSLTVKTLHEIARQGGYKRYSKLRKAELVAFIDGEVAIDHDGAAQVTILDVEVAADVPAIAKIMAAVAPVTFSAKPEAAVKAPESAPKAAVAVAPEVTEAEELIYAFRAMRTKIRDMGNTPLRVKIVARMRTLHTAIRATGFNMKTL